MVTLIPPSLLLGGCTPQQIEGDLNAVLDAATNVLLVVSPNASWVTSFQNAVGALKTAEATWTAGGTKVVVTDALNAIMAVTAAIPISASFSPLIDVLVAGVETVMSFFPASTTATAQALNPHVTAHSHVVIEHKFMRSRANDFKATWNKTAISHGLSKATI